MEKKAVYHMEVFHEVAQQRTQNDNETQIEHNEISAAYELRCAIEVLQMLIQWRDEELQNE